MLVWPINEPTEWNVSHSFAHRCDIYFPLMTGWMTRTRWIFMTTLPSLITCWKRRTTRCIEETNCFYILFVDSLQICLCKYSESNTVNAAGALVSSCFMRKFSPAKGYIYICTFYVHHKQYLLHLTVVQSSEHRMVAPKTNYKQKLHQDLSSRYANLKLSVI